MKVPRAVRSISVLLALVWVTPAVAHHSFSGVFDVSKTTTLTERIAKIEAPPCNEKDLSIMQDLTHHHNTR